MFSLSNSGFRPGRRVGKVHCFGLALRDPIANSPIADRRIVNNPLSGTGGTFIFALLLTLQATLCFGSEEVVTLVDSRHVSEVRVSTGFPLHSQRAAKNVQLQNVGVLFPIAFELRSVAESHSPVAAITNHSPTKPRLRCKYSVRDVAFVNVHGKPWQLQLIRPESASDAQFAEWNKILRSILEDSNVGYVWHTPDSAEATRLFKAIRQQATELPMEEIVMAIADSDNALIPFPQLENRDLTFEARIDSMLQSAARRKILEHTVDSLCVFVLFESDLEPENEEARKSLEQAIDRMNDQMWTLEKPTDKGPALVTIPRNQRDAEFWLRQSLRVDPGALPAVAIVFGQGRRLGEPIAGNELTAEKILARASLCGQDCECDLDREWLYGTQLIHVWSKELERIAEKSLSFDPHSAFVIAEVAQIVQKNANGIGRTDRIELGGGLIVHDLDRLVEEPPSEVLSQPSTTEQPQTHSNPPLIFPTKTGQENEPEGPEPAVSIPWILLGVLLALTFVAALYLQRRQA